jgi:hypothetical protein
MEWVVLEVLQEMLVIQAIQAMQEILVAQVVAEEEEVVVPLTQEMIQKDM